MYFCLSFVDWKTVIHSATSEGRVPDYMLLWGRFPPSNLVYYQQRYVEWKYEYLRDCCVGKLPGRPRISKTPFSHSLFLHTFFSSSQSEFASVFVMFSTDFTTTCLHVQKITSRSGEKRVATMLGACLPCAVLAGHLTMKSTTQPMQAHLDELGGSVCTLLVDIVPSSLRLLVDGVCWVVEWHQFRQTLQQTIIGSRAPKGGSSLFQCKGRKGRIISMENLCRNP